MKQQKESHVRSLLKGLTWRITGTLVAFAMSMILTGKMDVALQFAAADFVIKFLLYYLHERMWQFIPRGTIKALFRKKPKKDYEI